MTPKSRLAEARRFLISVGSPKTPGLPPLPRVEHDVARIAAIFCSPKQGYQRILTDRIVNGSSARVIHDAVYDWFTAPDRRSSDTVLLYFAGHGGDAGRAGNYYLFTSDTDENQLAKTAINVSALLQELYDGARERPQNVLLILDACYSGKGGAQSLAGLSRIRESGFLREGAGLWVVASADPLTEAGDGTFVNALEAVLADPAWAPQGGAEFLNPIEVMVLGVNARLQQSGAAQQAEGDVFGVRRTPRFIRNPNYTSKLDGAPLLDESHWDPKGRGVEGLASPGWYFTGRQRALRELTRWLLTPASDQRARVVTGGPGSGKSAVLGRLVMSAHSAKRAQMTAAGVLNPLDGTAPPVGSIRAYVHARGLSPEQIARSLARQLSSPDHTLDGVLRFLAAAAGPIGIVVDALDETASPVDSESSLLRKLADSSAVRLIVGTRRRGEQVPLAGAAVILDLDDPATYFDRTDMAGYALRRLLQSEPPTAYRDPSRHNDAQNLAAYVTERAGFSFLFARLVTRMLAGEQTPIDTSQPGWRTRVHVPEDLNQAFEYDLQRFEAMERRRIIDLLVPLAYARGKGLPQKNVWPAVASEISGGNYSNTDIRELKTLAGFYILQDTEDGQVVYRLFHQAFADYLKRHTRDEDVEVSFVRALRRASTPASDQCFGWDRVHDPYTLRYIGAHAAAAGLLDGMVQEPAFLTCAPPEAVLPHLHCLSSTAARRVAVAYRRVSHHMRAPLIQERISYLHLAALENGLDELAAGLAASALPYDWRAQWARWERAVPGEVVVESESAIAAIDIREISPDLTAVALGGNGAVQLWGLPGRNFLAQSQEFEGDLRYVSILGAEDRYWVAGVWIHQMPGQKNQSALTLRVLECPSCRLHAEVANVHPTAHWRPLAAAAAGTVGGLPTIALAGGDGKLSLWSVPSLEPLGMVNSGHPTDIRCMGFGVAEAGPVLVTSFDACQEGTYCDEGILTRSWTVPALTPLADHYYRSRGSARSMAMFKVASEQLAMVEYVSGYELEILDMSLQTRYEQHDGAAFDLTGAIGQSVGDLLCGLKYGKFCFAEVSPDGKGGLACRICHSRTQLRGSLVTAPARIHGRVALGSVDDGKRVRLWDIDEMVSSYTVDARVYAPSAESSFVPETDAIGAAVVDEASGTVIIGAQTGKIGAFDHATGALRWAHSSKPKLQIVGAVVADVDGRRVIVVADRGGELRTYDVETGDGIGPPIQTGNAIRSLTAQVIEGAPLCFVATRLASFRSGVCVFDLRTGEEQIVHRQSRRPLSRQLFIKGFEDKTLETVCVPLDDQGEPVVLIAGPYSFVRKWTWPPVLDEPVDLNMQERFGNMYVHSLVAGKLAGRLVAAAGNEQGLLAVWDLKTNALLHRIESAHKGVISALAIADWFGSGALISGGSGYVRIWSASLQPILQIDLEAKIVALAPLTEKRFFVATDKGFSVLAIREHLAAVATTVGW